MYLYYNLFHSSFVFGESWLEISNSTIAFTLTNTGKVTASETPQLYLGFPASTGEPPGQLKGFQKTTLTPGETMVVSLPLDSRAKSVWDPAAHTWSEVHGAFTVAVGASSRDIKLRGSFSN